MHREKNIIILSYCVLNQNSVVHPLARAKGAYNQIIQKILENNWGIHQLPCPESIYLGQNRMPMKKKEYENDGYLELCKKLAKEEVFKLKKYSDEGYKLIGLIGINHSPTCSVNGEKGLFIEILIEEFKKSDIKIEMKDIETKYIEENNNSQYVNELLNFSC